MSEQPSRRQQRGATAGPSSNTLTQTQTSHSRSQSAAPRVLRLRGQHAAKGRTVQWAEDVVDNEGLGRKSSKVCCIYHRPRRVDESSDDDSSSSDSDAESTDQEDEQNKASACGHGHGHAHGPGRKVAPLGDKKGGKNMKMKKRAERAPSPNAYEKVPRKKGFA
ncbi:hypothetical protein E4U21_004830 [Claviceps maximensis]|nr:hypothetical protein E4U21_004830 [Claviceps maximensis]